MMRQIPIHRSGHHKTLFLGGDRELVMVTGMITAILIFMAQEWAAAIFGVLLWLVGLFLLRLMGKHDPFLRQVYVRSLWQAEYYCAHSTPFRHNQRKFGDT